MLLPILILTFESVDETLWCNHSNKTCLAALSHGTIYSIIITNVLSLWIKCFDVTLQLKPLQQYSHGTIYSVSSTFESVDEIVRCCNSNETS